MGSLPVDRETFERLAAVLEELRARPDAGPLTRAVETATRAAAIDTGAIEGMYEVDRGFTLTVAVGTAAWEKVIAAREPIVRRSFEDALRAYDFVLDLATTRTEIGEKAIREIHQLICDGQETYRVVTSLGWQERPLPKGEYKDTPNNPTSRRTGEVHAYASPIDVPAEMHRLGDELRSDAFAAASPVLQSAYAHYAFVAVHPFADGNGRVARALASVFLYRRPGLPLVFTASLASLRETFLTKEGLPLDELDRLGRTIREAAKTEIKERLAALDLPPGVEWFETEDYPPGPLASQRIPATGQLRLPHVPHASRNQGSWRIETCSPRCWRPKVRRGRPRLPGGHHDR